MDRQRFDPEAGLEPSARSAARAAEAVEVLDAGSAVDRESAFALLQQAVASAFPATFAQVSPLKPVARGAPLDAPQDWPPAPGHGLLARYLRERRPLDGRAASG